MDKTCFCGKGKYCGYQIETDIQHDKMIYNKAIDDFEEQLRVHYAMYRDRGFVSDTNENIIRNVFEYAEMLRVHNS